MNAVAGHPDETGAIRQAQVLIRILGELGGGRRFGGFIDRRRDSYLLIVPLRTVLALADNVHEIGERMIIRLTIDFHDLGLLDDGDDDLGPFRKGKRLQQANRAIFIYAIDRKNNRPSLRSGIPVTARFRAVRRFPFTR